MSAVADDQRKTYPAMTDSEAIDVIVKTIDLNGAGERADAAETYRVVLSALEDERRALLSRQEALLRGGPVTVMKEKAVDEDKD